MNIKFKSTWLLLSMLAACSPDQQKEQPQQLTTYNSTEIGWTITIPYGYQALSENRMNAIEKKGKEALGKSAANEISTDKLLKLVNFQKNQFNSFLATAEKFDLNRDGAYQSNNQLGKKLIYDTYTNQKIKVDTLSGTELIAGKQFYTYYIKIYGPSGEVLMNQVMYNQLIKGYDFGVNMNYNNEADREVLINALKKSKFSN